MTCIVAIREKTKIWMGGDAAGTAGQSTQPYLDKKVFMIGNPCDRFLIGYTSSYRMGQLIQYVFKPPQCKSENLTAYMVCAFIPALQKCLAEGGYEKKENEVKQGGQFLVGFRNRIFVIDSDYQALEPTVGYAAVGSGRNVALGSLYSTALNEDPTPGRLSLALHAAQNFITSVCGPFEIISL